tara:strand:- start:213 stop:686 length:474 start_codon:yes stop_codon:yes gene_type:complete
MIYFRKHYRSVCGNSKRQKSNMYQGFGGHMHRLGYSNNRKRRSNTRKSNNSIYYENIDSDDEPILFSIVDRDNFIIDDILGITKENIDKPRVVDENVLYGDLVIAEEKRIIDKIYNDYKNSFEIGTNEIIRKQIEEIRKQTNWKLRVLKEVQINEKK